jgi:hypothetical protein
MTAVARIAVLHLRTVAPYRTQGLLVFGLLMLILARNPDHVVPALVVLLAPLIAVQPFVVADKADLGTLYAVLPVPRRTVLLGHYAWALESFLATALAGTAASALLAWAEGLPFGGRDPMTMVTLSWAGRRDPRPLSPGVPPGWSWYRRSPGRHDYADRGPRRPVALGHDCRPETARETARATATTAGASAVGRS